MDEDHKRRQIDEVEKWRFKTLEIDYVHV